MNWMIALLAFLAGSNPPEVPSDSALELMRMQAPDASVAALRLALKARVCAQHNGEVGSRLAVIDYSRPSSTTRLWVFDFAKVPTLLFAELVAHGRGSGGDLALDFSNREGSHQSSLGLFRTGEPYQGHNGYSLRLDGLEPGFNDQARARAIVMHGAPYVDPATVSVLGRLGRSFGCPAVRPAVARTLIDTLRDGQLVFAYYPDHDWLAASNYLNCSSSRKRAETTGADGQSRVP